MSKIVDRVLTSDMQVALYGTVIGYESYRLVNGEDWECDFEEVEDCLTREEALRRYKQWTGRDYPYPTIVMN